MNIHDRQREHLAKTCRWAQEIREHLQPILDANPDRVHFRPSTSGVAMIGLTSEQPQRGKSAIRDLKGLAANFDAKFHEHFVDVEQGKTTPEKRLQSWLIAEAQNSHRRMTSLNRASDATGSPVELVFVTDEIAVPTSADGNRRILCDILAARVYADSATPVVIELKTKRELKRLVQQVNSYAALVDEHAQLFAQLYGNTLGGRIANMARCEKWIVWPMKGELCDPRQQQLAAEGIRVVGYEQLGDGFRFRVGDAAVR